MQVVVTVVDRSHHRSHIVVRQDVTYEKPVEQPNRKGSGINRATSRGGLGTGESSALVPGGGSLSPSLRLEVSGDASTSRLVG